ncbi:MAG: hypothetical protein FRX49_01527 [Trebouxia sp. A1-2]|nr:MAG: hypothetical protein FRX49_01527 [Trebouxia sp. A1-2]
MAAQDSASYNDPSSPLPLAGAAGTHPHMTDRPVHATGFTHAQSSPRQQSDQGVVEEGIAFWLVQG